MNPLLAADTTTTTSDSGLFNGVDDFFNSGTWLVIRNLAIFFVVVFWLASVYWVYKDARRRIGDPWLVAYPAGQQVSLGPVGHGDRRRGQAHHLPSEHVVPAQEGDAVRRPVSRLLPGRG